MSSFSIRKASNDDLTMLSSVFESTWQRTHADDINDQKQGSLSFFVAWKDNMPVGHAFVSWLGPRALEPATRFPKVPELNRLAVLEEHRRQGIATTLIAECEAEAMERGITMLGMGTDPDIPPDSNLYIRLGYVDSGVGIFDDVYRSVRSGEEVREPTQFLVKDLIGRGI